MYMFDSCTLCLDLRGAFGDVIILQPTPSRNPNDPLEVELEALGEIFELWPCSTIFSSCFRSVCLIHPTSLFSLHCSNDGFSIERINAATPTWAPMHRQLGFSYAILQDSYAAGSATLCVGALLFIPIALKFGRRVVYLISLFLQFFVSIWSAKLETVADLVLVNAFNCLLGALAEAIVQMTIADVFFIHQRGRMNSIYVWVMIVGCSLAPLVAGFISNSQGWRWVWWWMAILFGACFILFLYFYEETKFVDSMTGVALTRSSIEIKPTPTPADTDKEKQKCADGVDLEEGMKSESKDKAPEARMDETKYPKFPQHMTEIDIDPDIPRKRYLERLKLWVSFPGSVKYYVRHAYQPLIVIVQFPAALYVSVLYGLITAAWQAMITVVSSVMAEPPYNFNAAQIGLMSLAPFIGNTIGTLIFGIFSDWLALKQAKKNNGIFEPEMRLWTVLGATPLAPAGILIFGYALGNGAPWIVVAVGYAIYGFGMAPVSSAALTYLTDAYTNIVADSLVGVTFIRNLLATILIFALTPWIEAVGISSVFLTLSLLSLAVLVPGTLCFLYFGKRLRVRTASRYRHYSTVQVENRSA
ncbi:major facilitator superfamily domain-containing protein [Penicillium riverlandense]|uniref:major facilitator superfamily domain-containing protein n=1 Tax=Penicillium riverlandense TaxID=1903569 RepID=UPI00254939D7|nr:major facilitator superfamily domain-containing protein [Penicillium riverlandense]KAJ5832496.1 major facilitator superfamily domain-containing protein [Penicillium riverlandense]